MPNIITQSVIKAKNQNSKKTVNHLVPYSEVSIIQSLPCVSACKNHLVIVRTIQLSPDENRHDVHEDQGNPRCVQTQKNPPEDCSSGGFKL